jgi:hypothetical protein
MLDIPYFFHTASSNSKSQDLSLTEVPLSAQNPTKAHVPSSQDFKYTAAS